MGDAACEPAKGVELLSVAQRLFRLGALIHFGLEAQGGIDEFAGALEDALLETLVEDAQIVLGLPQAQEGGHCGHQLVRLDRLDEAGIRAAFEADRPILRLGEGCRGLQHDGARNSRA